MGHFYVNLLFAVFMMFAPQVAYSKSNANGKGIICSIRMESDAPYVLGFKFGMGGVVGEKGWVIQGDTVTTELLGNHGKFLSTSDRISWIKNPNLDLSDPKNEEYHLDRKTLQLKRIRGDRLLNILRCNVFSNHEEYETEMSRLQKIQQDEYDLSTKDNKI